MRRADLFENTLILGKIEGERRRILYSKQKQCPVVDVTGDGNKIGCCKEQYSIGTWNIRSMNQGKLEVFKHEMARVNIDILGISDVAVQFLFVCFSH